MSSKQILERKLSTLIFKVDNEPHIKVNTGNCTSCSKKQCLICPASCYSFDEKTQKLITNFDGCLECGTCRRICPFDSINWSYPKGGFGVTYRLG